jgi:ribose 5-phosphate isomerase B
MVIYLGADHRGFELKISIGRFLLDSGYEVEDVTPQKSEWDDYPDAAAKVARKVHNNLGQGVGILICGSGAGVDIVANKFRKVRSVLGFAPDQVFDARHDDNVNVLSLSADFTDYETAKNMVRIFLETKFEEKEERFQRRIQKILEIEREISGTDLYAG